MASSPRLILALLRRLPEGSHYAAAMSAAPETVAARAEADKSPAVDPAVEARTWTLDRTLMAQLINSVNALVTHSIPWEQGKAPKLPVVGPAAWRGETTGAPAKPLSVLDVFNKVTGNNGR